MFIVQFKAHHGLKMFEPREWHLVYEIELMLAEARNARLLLALGKVKAEGGREVSQLVIVTLDLQPVYAVMCLAWKSQPRTQQTTLTTL